ncbi:MAG: 3-dehydroquinate synthase [Treponema sp.]|nr:3-dehydroquinate synthase [Treponema sp.]
MDSNEFILKYAEDSGFDKTCIYFYSGSPNLNKVFFSENDSGKQPRLFVTDTSIARLDSIKDFIALFECDANGANSSANSSGFLKEGSVLKYGSDYLLVLGAGEKFKTIDSVLTIVRTALERNFTRNCTFVAIGGGVLSDMTAFAASIFKRGIKVEFVPTTVLSMVDASVGGKTGCDIEGFKNMIGSFWPASKLYVWSNFALSLPENEYISGLAEAIKTAFLFDKEMLRLFEEEKDAIMKRDSSVLEKIIGACVRAKAKIVQEDPRENGRRAFLNLGHTFGHALEAAAGLGCITHGEAVAWGIGRAADLSLLMGLCSKEFAKKTKDIIASYGYDSGQYPKVLSGEEKSLGIEKMLQAMKKDKKNTSLSQIRLTLQKGECDTIITTAKDSDIEQVLGKTGI